MDCLVKSCEQFELYPQNLVQPGVTIRNLKAFSRRLQSLKCYLFCDQQLIASRPSDRHSAVDFIDINGEQDPRVERVTDLESLINWVRPALKPGRSDPLCRFIFIHARHSRAPLSIAQDMFKFLASYHQISPSFLDFVFPFGSQVGARDAYFSGLRDESRIAANDRFVEIPQLLRSGSDLRLCYNLRSVEPSESDPQLPWSIRQCAIYHSFDIQTGQALWVTVKGNELMKELVHDEGMLAPLSQSKSRSELFSSTLDVHLMFCDWSSENWRWYVNDLEEKVRQLAPGAIAVPVDKPRTPPPVPINFLRSPRQRMDSFPSTIQSPTSPISPVSRSGTFSLGFPSRSSTIVEKGITQLATEESCYSKKNWTNTTVTDAKHLRRSLTSLYSTLNAFKSKEDWQESGSQSFPSLNETQPPSAEKPSPPERPPNFAEGSSDTAHDNFKFEDLQNAEYIEEKLQDALLHLRLNVGVLEELRQFYQNTSAYKEWPADIERNGTVQKAHFDKCVLGIIKDMRMLQSRIETLLQLLVNRKHLLNCILQHKSTKANDSFAKKAHDSATFMNAMTIEMHSIAKKTERETVSMRAITSVTLFFLPATFLASFMSTDIIDFKDGKQDLQLKGLKLYLIIALPATFLTFLAWYCISWLAKDKAEKATDEHRAAEVV